MFDFFVVVVVVVVICGGEEGTGLIMCYFLDFFVDRLFIFHFQNLNLIVANIVVTFHVGLLEKVNYFRCILFLCHSSGSKL